MQRHQIAVAILALTLMISEGWSAVAQDWPTRPITMVVPYGAGGPTDTIGRIVAEGMRHSLGQPVVIENVAGASATIGVGRVARATPDGYTVGIGGWSPNVLNGAMFNLAYDVYKDFQPIALIAENPFIIVTRKSLAAKDLKELIAWLKINPGKATQGTTGAGGGSHVAGVFFQSATGTQFQFVPYRLGAGQAMQDLVAGQIDLLIDLAANALPQVRAGTIKAFAITAKNRLVVAPDIPTAEEQGLPNFYLSFWHGLWAPKGTKTEVVAKLNRAVVDALAAPSVRSRLVDLGQEIFPREQQTPEALAAFHKAEIEKWWPIIKAAGIKAE
jgi:tripartite-type tricarboxylate transporter receptor subunit TctC